MNDATLSKIYGTVGVALFGFSINIFWWERTGGTILKTIVPHKELAASILIGQFGITMIGLFVVYVARRYSKRKSAVAWFLRLPPAFFELGGSKDPLAVFIRLLGVICFLFVPGYISGHFLIYLWNIPIADRRDEVFGLNFHALTSDFTRSGTFGDDNRFRLEHRDGVTFFPGLEGTLLSALTLAFIVAILAYMTLLFQRQAGPNQLRSGNRKHR